MHHLDLCPLGHPLDHEVFDDSVKLGAIVVTSASQLSKVLAGLWSMLPVQLQHNDAHAGLQVNVGRLPGVWGNRRHGEAGGILLYQRLLPVSFRGDPTRWCTLPVAAVQPV